MSPDKTLFRALGFLPLIFFLTQAVHYWRIDELGHLLWMCNIGNLLLAIGLFLNRRLLIRVAVIWMVPGLVVWVVYVVLAWGVFFSSTLAHAGGMGVGIIVIRKVGMERRAWVYAFCWYLMMQLLSYLITSPVLNVNVAHAVAPGWERTFSNYWKFWVVLTLGTAVVLWLVNLLLYSLWPSTSDETLKLEP